MIEALVQVDGGRSEETMVDVNLGCKEEITCDVQPEGRGILGSNSNYLADERRQEMVRDKEIRKN